MEDSDVSGPSPRIESWEIIWCFLRVSAGEACELGVCFGFRRSSLVLESVSHAFAVSYGAKVSEYAIQHPESELCQALTPSIMAWA